MTKAIKIISARLKAASIRKMWMVWILTSAAYLALAQQGDSLRTQVLEEIVFEGVKPEGDTLQNFYRSNAAATTETILSRMKGVTLIRRGAYGQEPVFRGLSGGQLNVNIDGMKIFGACTDKMDPVTIYVEPQNLSAIQAMLGTQGSKFGSTIGGTLNMKLAQAIVREPGIQGQAGIDYQSSAHAFNYFSGFNISGNESAYRVSATYRKSGNYRAGGGEEIPFSQYEKINIATSGKWTLGEYDTLRADILFDQGWNIGFPALPMDVGKATAGIYAVSYHRVAPWYIFHNLTAKVYHNNISHNMDDTHRKDVVMHMDMPGKSQTTGLFAEGDVHIFHNHRTVVKAEYFSNQLMGEMTMYPEEGPPMYMQTAPEAHRQDGGIFVSQEITFNDRNKTLLSFRGDLVRDDLYSGIGRQQWEVFYPDLSTPSFRFAKTVSALYTHKPANNIRLEIQTGYGERVATLNERYGFYLFNRYDGYDYLGNPGLKNEVSWNAEVTFNYFGEKIEWQVTPFYQRISDYIMGRVREDLSVMTPGANGVKQNINLSRATLSGVDVMLLASPVPSLQAIATLKYTRGTNALQEDMPLIPPLKTVASLRYEIKNLHIQTEWEWAAEQTHVSKSSGEQPTSSYSILSFRTGIKINSFWQCNAGVENLFDRYYREHLDWGRIPRAGRNVYLNVIYKF